MKATGIVRKLDKLGRIVIPMETRRVLNIGPEDPVEIFTEGDTIILKKYQPGCVLTGSTKDLVSVGGVVFNKDALKEVVSKL